MLTIVTIFTVAVLSSLSGVTPVLLSSHLQDLMIAGAVVNQATLQTLNRSFKAVFEKAFESMEPAIMALSMQVTSTSYMEEYGWLKAMTELREWIGDRHVEQLAVEGYTLRNKKFEKTIAVSREDIEDDRIGMYEPRVRMLAALARRHPGGLLISLLQDGETTPCYDGAEFFDTQHPNGDQGVFSNLLDNSPLSATNYESARELMMSYVTESGDSLGLPPDTLVVPPQLEKEAREILNSTAIIGDGTAGGSKSNVWHGSADLIVEPRLSNKAGEWYLASLKMPFKPFIFQTRRAVELKAMDNPDDPNVFFKDEYLYGVDYRGAAGYGLPHLIVKARASA